MLFYKHVEGGETIQMDTVSLTIDSSEEGVLVDARQLYRHDPMFVLLKERWQLEDRWILLGSAALPALPLPFWAAWIGAAPVSAASFWTLSDTMGAILEICIVFPLVFLIYLHLPAWLAGLFNQLQANRVIGSRRNSNRFVPASYRHFVQLFTNWTDTSWWVVGAIALIVLYLCYRIPVVELSHVRLTPLWLRCLNLVFFMPLMYVTFLCIARIVVAFVALNWLFLSFTIQVRPLHPDGSGGLGALGRITWISVILLLWDALLLYTGQISHNVSVFSSPEIFLLAMIYLVLVPFVFIGWLLLPHIAMVKARDTAVCPLVNELYQLMSQTAILSHEDTETMKTTTDRLVELERRVHFLRDSFPTWPVEIQTLGRLAAALILPALLPIVLPPLFSWISQLLGVLK